MSERVFFTIKEDIGSGVISFYKENDLVKVSYGIQNSTECFLKKIIVVCEMCKEVLKRFETDKVWNILKQQIPKELSTSEFVSYLMGRL